MNINIISFHASRDDIDNEVSTIIKPTGFAASMPMAATDGIVDAMLMAAAMLVLHIVIHACRSYHFIVSASQSIHGLHFSLPS